MIGQPRTPFESDKITALPGWPISPSLPARHHSGMAPLLPRQDRHQQGRFAMWPRREDYRVIIPMHYSSSDKTNKSLLQYRRPANQSPQVN
jgi:hypothetical protein